jgi:hypothetical protein
MPPRAVANTEQVSATARRSFIDERDNLLQKPISLCEQLINVVIDYFAYFPDA